MVSLMLLNFQSYMPGDEHEQMFQVRQTLNWSFHAEKNIVLTHSILQGHFWSLN